MSAYKGSFEDYLRAHESDDSPYKPSPDELVLFGDNNKLISKSDYFWQEYTKELLEKEKKEEEERERLKAERAERERMNEINNQVSNKECADLIISRAELHDFLVKEGIRTPGADKFEAEQEHGTREYLDAWYEHKLALERERQERLERERIARVNELEHKVADGPPAPQIAEMIEYQHDHGTPAQPTSRRIRVADAYLILAFALIALFPILRAFGVDFWYLTGLIAKLLQ